MAMPVGVGALAKNLVVLLRAPLFTIHPVGGVKVFFACYIYHHNNCGCKYTKQKQGRCFILALIKLLHYADIDCGGYFF